MKEAKNQNQRGNYPATIGGLDNFLRDAGVSHETRRKLIETIKERRTPLAESPSATRQPKPPTGPTTPRSPEGPDRKTKKKRKGFRNVRPTQQPERSSRPSKSSSPDRAASKDSKRRLSRRQKVALGIGALVVLEGLAFKGGVDQATQSPDGQLPNGSGDVEIQKIPVPLVDGLTQEQINLIASADVGGSIDIKDSQGNPKVVTEEMKRQGMIAMLKVFNDQEIRDYAQQNGVNLTVLFTQFTLESAYGHSDKAEFHNYFGIKKPSGWTGQIVNLPAVEGGTADWPVFPDAKTGVMEAMKIFVAKEWYKDARAHANDISLYIDGMQNQLDVTGAIEIAGKLAYAGDPLYKEKLLNLIEKLHVAQLINSPLYTEVAVPKPNATETRLQNFKLDPAQYLAIGQGKWNVNFPKEWMVKLADGSEVPLVSLSWEQRYQMVETQLNNIVLTKEGYEAFKKNLQDISAQVQAAGLKNFMGPRLPDDQVKYFVAHYTVTNSNPSLNGIQAAGSMNNGDAGVSSWKYIDKNLNTSILTYSETGNILGHNHETRGTEVESQSQETTQADQYEQLIYSLIDDLDRHERFNGVTTSAQIQQIVDGQIRGHGEFNAGHSDFSSIVMDPIRTLMKDFLVHQLGYNKGAETNGAIVENALHVGPDGRINKIDLDLAA